MKLLLYVLKIKININNHYVYEKEIIQVFMSCNVKTLKHISWLLSFVLSSIVQWHIFHELREQIYNTFNPVGRFSQLEDLKITLLKTGMFYRAKKWFQKKTMIIVPTIENKGTVVVKYSQLRVVHLIFWKRTEEETLRFRKWNLIHFIWYIFFCMWYVHVDKSRSGSVSLLEHMRGFMLDPCCSAFSFICFL